MHSSARYILCHRTLQRIIYNLSVLASMADGYVESVRRGDVPCVESVLRTTAERENIKAIEESVALYRQLMSQSLQVALETVQEFVGVHVKSEDSALGHFTRLVIFDSDGESHHQLEVLRRLCLNFVQVFIFFWSQF